MSSSDKPRTVKKRLNFAPPPDDDSTPPSHAKVTLNGVASAALPKPRGRPFAKGNTLRKDGKAGRKKGTPNKVTSSVAAALQAAFDKLGGEDGLVTWAKTDPGNMSTFYQLAARLIPQQVTGNNFGPVAIEQPQRESLSDKVLAAASALSAERQPIPPTTVAEPSRLTH